MFALLCCALLATSAWAADWASTSVGLDGTAGRVVAVADWDNDQNVDLLLYSDAGRSVQPWLWQDSGFVPGGVTNLSAALVSVAPADLDRDGFVDAALALDDGSVQLLFHERTASGHRLRPSPVFPLGLDTVSPQLDAADIYGSCALPSLVATDAAGVLQVFQLRYGAMSGSCAYAATTVTEPVGCAVARRAVAGTTAMVDLDGDCVSDLVFGVSAGASVAYHAATALPGGPSDCAPADVASWVGPVAFSVPASFGHPTWEDYNGDGAADVAFPACVNTTTMQVDACDAAGYNAVVVLWNHVSGEPCSDGDCCSRFGWRFPSVAVGDPVGRAGIAVSLMRGVRLTTTTRHPAVLRPGDYDADRFTDFVVATTRGPMLLHNDGTGRFSGGPLGPELGVHFEPELTPFFFDLDSNGHLDLLVTPQNASDLAVHHAFTNNAVPLSYYFFTATTLNGALTGNVFGAVQPGATHRLQFIDVKQKTQTAVKTQTPTLAAHALRFPRSHFGLAETFSYIVNFATGFRVTGGDGQSRTWPTYLMPNSQVVVNAEPITRPSSWELRLFIQGSRFTRAVLMAWGAALVLIGIPIIVLKVKEVQADRRERKAR